MIKPLTTEEFIQKSILKHSVKYDYSKVEYKNNRIKLNIGCSVHGFFEQRGGDHLAGKGCKKCANDNLKSDFKYFLKKSKEIHGNLYKYPYNDYITSTSKIRIICKKHGEFKQIACSHTRGQGCPKCKADKNGSRQTRQGNEVLKDMFLKHNYKYLYPDFSYKKTHSKINISCKEHGLFKQSISKHLRGQGCPKCTNIVSKPEIELSYFIKSLNMKIQTSTRKYIYPYELDIYIPSLKKAIEFNGEWWHYNHSNPTCKPRGYHAMKSNLCREKGIKLLHIREDLWKRDKEKMKEIIIKYLENGISI